MFFFYVIYIYIYKISIFFYMNIPSIRAAAGASNSSETSPAAC